MIEGKPIKKMPNNGMSELTPAVIESAILEVLTNANEILEMYGIDGDVISLSLGLLPHLQGKKKRMDEDSSQYELSLNTGKDHALVVTYRHNSTLEEDE